MIGPGLSRASGRRWPWVGASAALALAIGPTAGAATPASAGGTASATVVAPITVTAVDDLDFGTLTSGDSPGSVAVAPLGSTATYGGGVEAICGDTCAPPHPARFSVKGEPTRSYLVTTPPSVTIAPSGSGSGSVVESIRVATASRRSPDGRGQLDEQGTDRFEVGGTLHLEARAAAGHYVAQIPVTVTYY